MVLGPISRPDSAPMNAAIENALRPACSVDTPINRAPSRLMAVARSALPASVRAKNRNRPAINRADTSSVTMACPEMVTAPIEKLASQNGGVR